MIVMAATPARQIEALTRTRPRSMLPVVGKPTIARVLDSYYQVGIRRFTVVVGERDGDLAKWLSTRWQADVKLNLAPQGYRRGTASALYATREYIDAPFILTSCDTIVSVEHIARLYQYFETYRVDATVLSLLHGPTNPESPISVLRDPRGQVFYISEKPAPGHQANLFALPIYGFTPKVLDYLDRVPVDEESGERSLSAAIQLMIDDGLPVGAIEAEWALTIRTPADLMQANRHFLSRLSRPSLWSDLPRTAVIKPPVHIDPGVKVGAKARIGPNVYIETGSVIGQEAVLKNAVILGKQIGKGIVIDGEIISNDRI